MNGQARSTVSHTAEFATKKSRQRTRRLKPHIPELLLGCIVLFDTTKLASFSLPFAHSEIAGVGLACLALIRIKIRVPATAKWFQFTLVAMGLSMLLTTIATESYVISRMGHLLVWGLVAWGIAAGKVHLPSLASGLGVGVIAGSIYGMAFLGQSNYPGRLTGILGDPNTAGMYLLVGACLAMAYTQSRLLLAAIGMAAIYGLYLTGSRTSLFALALVLAWLILLRFLPRWISIIGLSSGILWFARSNSVDFAIGSFSDRIGSDVLRQHIVEAEQEKFASGSFYGQGLGQAFVILQDGERFFFHSSYLASMVEVGWLTTAMMLGLFAYILLKTARAQPTRETVFTEASLLVILICAVNLGEVIYTIPTAIAIGAGVHSIARTKKRNPA